MTEAPLSPVKLSIVLPTYNRKELVLRAINSALEQLTAGTELVVIDDGSTDSSKDALDGIKTDKNLVIHHFNENKGVNAARNHGVLLSKGEYILFLDSDEYLLKGSLDKVLRALNTESAAGHLWFVRLEEESLKRWNDILPKDSETITFYDQVRHKYGGDYVHVLKQEHLRRFPFFEQFRASEYLNWLRVLRECSDVRFLNIPVVMSRKDSVDSLRKSLALNTALRIEEKFRSNLKEIDLFMQDYLKYDKVYFRKLLIKTILLGIASSDYSRNAFLLKLLKGLSFTEYAILVFINWVKPKHLALFLIKAKTLFNKMIN